MLGTLWMNRGEGDEARKHLENALRLVKERRPSQEKAFVLQELSRVAMMADDFERAIELGSESLRMAEELGLDATRSRNLNTLGVARIWTGDRGGVHDLEEAVAIAAGANSHEECAAAANLTWMTAALGDLRRAGALHEQTRRTADRVGLDSYIRWQRGEHVFHCHWEGRWDEALTTADAFIREVEAETAHYMETSCRYIRAAIRLARGDPESALADARRAVEVARGAKDPQALNPALAFEARALAATGDRERADAVAKELLAAWSESGVRPPHEAVDGAWAYIELGRRGELVDALDRARLQTPWHEAARLIAAGDFAGAADVYAEIGSVPDEAYARLRAAAELVQSGRRAEADAQLRIALPVFARLGATAWAAAGEALLAASA